MFKDKNANKARLNILFAIIYLFIPPVTTTTYFVVIDDNQWVSIRECSYMFKVVSSAFFSYKCSISHYSKLHMSFQNTLLFQQETWSYVLFL